MKRIFLAFIMVSTFITTGFAQDKPGLELETFAVLPFLMSQSGIDVDPTAPLIGIRASIRNRQIAFGGTFSINTYQYENLSLFFTNPPERSAQDLFDDISLDMRIIDSGNVAYVLQIGLSRYSIGFALGPHNIRIGAILPEAYNLLPSSLRTGDWQISVCYGYSFMIPDLSSKKGSLNP